MDPDLLVRGAVIGLAIAAPVGPIGVLCIRRTLAEGWTFGFVSGLGAATADALYGCIAAFGLTFISAALISHQTWLRLIGGLFLCTLGVKTLLARPAAQAAPSNGGGLWSAYASTLLLTLTNPMTILAFAAIFAGLGLAERTGGASGGYNSAGLLVLGVFLGSACWWLLLSSVFGAFRTRFSASGLLWVNRISGIVILGFGVAALVAAARVGGGGWK
jgi:threonine/homoserine/homoserine lactone efflux protein